MRVEPDDGEPVVLRREALDRADVRAAAPAEDERPLGQLRGDREGLLAERLLLDHRRFRVRDRKRRRRDHHVAAVAPGARNADQAGPERAPARVALVLRPERDRGESTAVGAPSAQAAHGSSSFS